MATKKQQLEFIAMIAPIAQAKSKGRVLPSVCIAQACCESGYGTSSKMVHANALFGIKVGSSKAHFGNAWHDKAYSTRTKECYDGKTYVAITDMFRAYDSVEDAVEDYYDMLAACKRYKACIGQKDPLACITAIKNGGYATSPTYVNTIMGIIKQFDLTRYDSVATSQPAKATPYKVGSNYILQYNMYIRDLPRGTKKTYLQLSTNAKCHAYQDAAGHGILKNGTVVTCKEIREQAGEIWIRIPSGWVCGVGTDGQKYVV